MQTNHEHLIAIEVLLELVVEHQQEILRSNQVARGSPVIELRPRRRRRKRKPPGDDHALQARPGVVGPRVRKP